MDRPIKILANSNFSKLLTGFGKNMRNILIALHNDPEFEVIEAANGARFGTDLLTPWKSYGTSPSTNEIIQEIGQDGNKHRMASYGFYEIDKIIELEQPDVYLGIEDIWAFNGFKETKPWWNKIHKIIWTTLDSLPIIPDAYHMAKSCDKFLVWASFSEQEMKKTGINNVQTIHGAIDLQNFKPLTAEERKALREKHGLEDCFVTGFVFKNQLRKSVPNLLDGFKLFKQKYPESNPKLLLHTDWADNVHGWDIPRFIREKNIDPNDVLCCYSCASCGEFSVQPFKGDDQDCHLCHTQKSLKSKNSIHGLSENQLNEIYNLMDVYCHPFTSGGQELPIQEAKSAGLITLVTEYSCGLDSCYEHQGGLPLAWSEYREPQSQFIKATTCPNSICERLFQVYTMPEEEKQRITANGRKVLDEKFSIDVVVSQLKKAIKETIARPIVKVEQNFQKPQSQPFKSLLDGQKKGRILVVLSTDLRGAYVYTAILSSLKAAYGKDIYLATEASNHEVFFGNPNIHKVLNFHPTMEDIGLMEREYFDVCLVPHVGARNAIDFSHQNKDKLQYQTLEFN